MKRIILAAAATLVACSPQVPWATSPDSARLGSAAATITAEDLYERIAFLAADELRGRDTPSPGLEMAAEWIADELGSFGLVAAGDDDWFQRYPYPAEALDTARTTFASVAGATHSFRYGHDFFAWSGPSPRADVGAVYVPAGLGDGPELLRDRAAVVRLPHVPGQGPRGYGFDRDALRDIASVRAAAREAGAVAVVFLLDAAMTPDQLQALAQSAEAPGRTLGGTPEDGPPPAFFITRGTAERMFRMADLDPAVLDDGVARPTPLSGLTLRVGAPLRRLDDARPPNVVGLLRGSDPELRDTYVVVSAHMDHVGVGRPDETGDSIYNGADDDASGTAVLVEVAEAMARLDPRPRRSIIFLAVSGEEKGLLGSRWFAENPTVPLDAIVANINIDMVGRNAPDSIVVIGQEYSSLGPAVHEVARRHAQEVGLTVSEDLWPDERFFFRSDHFNFARKEIPALFFFAGVHEDYHRPGDEVHLIDTDKTARVGRLVFYLTHGIADSPTPPAWDPAGLEEVRRLTRQ